MWLILIVDLLQIKLYHQPILMFFSWLDPLFCIRFKKPSLDHTDLYAHPSECDASYLHNKFMR